MQAATWKDKITDPANLWLNATRMEDEGHLPEAAVLYLSEASDALKRGLVARAALSCSCAAGCIERTGRAKAARDLYFEAAILYEEAADAVFGSSIREALWLLQASHDYFILGGDAEKAAKLYQRCASLARKSSPFISADALDGVLRIRRDAKPKATPHAPEAKSPEVDLAIEGFLRLRGSTPPEGAPKPPADPKQSRLYRRPSIEKSIVS